jgi:hypothetical protein
MPPIIPCIACNENTSEFEFTDKFQVTEGITINFIHEIFLLNIWLQYRAVQMPEKTSHF